jgi:hypothetical protein
VVALCELNWIQVGAGAALPCLRTDCNLGD